MSNAKSGVAESVTAARAGKFQTHGTLVTNAVVRVNLHVECVAGLGTCRKEKWMT